MIRRLALALLLITLSHSFALAEKRVALIIGNSDYETVASLRNPANDARRLASVLQTAGFSKVTLELNLKGFEFQRKLEFRYEAGF